MQILMLIFCTNGSFQGRQEGGTGTFCPGSHSAYGPQKDRYTLIEQSCTLLKQSLHIFCPGALKLSLLPWII